jgi:hypothetical protein
MKKRMNKIIFALVLLVSPIMGFGAAYDDDKTNFFVSGAGANEALGLVNQIICFVKNTRAEEFVNDGVYRATIYADDCVTTSADSSSASAAKPKSSKASGGDKQGATAEQKTASTAILRVTRADESSPVLSKGWLALVQKEDMGNGQTMEMQIDVYMDIVQSAGVSAEAPQGEWTMRYSLASGADMEMGPGFILPKGTPLGIGYIDAKGKALRFKDNGFEGSGNVIANFAASGDIEGIYMEEMSTGIGVDISDGDGDVGSGSNVGNEVSYVFGDLSCNTLDGAKVKSTAGEDLGFFGSASAPDSIMNPVGRFGSDVGADSVRNSVSLYGSTVGVESANNSVSAVPPEIYQGSTFIGHLTTNSTLIGISLDSVDALECSFSAVLPNAANELVADGGNSDGSDGGSDEEGGDFDDDSGSLVFVQNSFVIDAANKVFCKKLLKAEKMDFSKLNQETFAPSRSDYTPVEGDGLATDETCYSTDVSKAYRNVWRYGVYDADGGRFDLSNQAFPLKAFIDKGTENEKEVFAYAGYWGVHVDPESIGSVTDTLEFEKEDFAGEAGSARPTFTLKSKNVRLEKREKEYVSLNSLSGMTIGVNMADDSYWKTELTAVNEALADNTTYNEYEGSFDAATQTFTFTDGIKFFPNYAKETLTTPITFTVSDWLSNMKKVVGAGEEWEFTEYANMFVYSHDTQQGYSINEKAFNNPSDGTAPTDDNDTSAGVASEVTSVVKDFAEIAGGLRCLRECPTSTLLAQSYADALTKAQAANGEGISEASPSPFAAPGPYVTQEKTVTINRCPEGVDSDDCKEQRTYQKGEWIDGFIAEEITQYAVVDGVITENGQPLSTGIADTVRSLMADGTIRDTRDLFQGAKALVPDGQQDLELDLSWGLMSGQMVLASDLAKLECTKNQDTGKYEGETPPEFTDDQATETRYCLEKLWSNKSLTTYNMVFELQPAFEIFDSGGNPVAFDPPKMLYFQVPDDETLYGKDAGKNLRLEYGGFGDLHGIPGNVIDINTGENLGQYFDGQWQENYRYLSRFILPTGSEVQDKVTGLSYKVKALNGEEYLSLAPGAKGTVIYTATSDDLIPDSLMIDVGPNGGDNYIGIKPAKSEMINGGEPAVVHGKVVFDPSAD